jgi:hypothetical protein
MLTDRHGAGKRIGMLWQLLLAIVILSNPLACGERQDAAVESRGAAVSWTQVGEMDRYTYYADYASIQRADEIVTMWDLLNYKVPQTDRGSDTYRSKATHREYDCQGEKSQALKSFWYAEDMAVGKRIRSENGGVGWAPAVPGTATASLLKVACGKL